MTRVPLLCLPLPILLSGCIVADVAKTTVSVASIPVKVAAAGVDAATTSQAETDEKQGRALREADERRGRQARLAAERCAKGRPLPGEPCPPRPD